MYSSAFIHPPTHTFLFFPCLDFLYSFSILSRQPSLSYIVLAYKLSSTNSAFQNLSPSHTMPWIDFTIYHTKGTYNLVEFLFYFCFWCKDYKKFRPGRRKWIVKPTVRMCGFLIISLWFKPEFSLNEDVCVYALVCWSHRHPFINSFINSLTEPYYVRSIVLETGLSKTEVCFSHQRKTWKSK